MLQIAPPSREKVNTYQEIRANLDSLSGRINGEYADIDWVPIRYVNKGFRGRCSPASTARRGSGW